MEGKLIKQEKEYYALYTNKGIFISDVNGGSLANRLSLKNCQAIENGYDLDELFESILIGPTDENGRWKLRAGFITGFKKAVELLGDKKFTKEDMGRIMVYGYDKSTENEYLSRIPFDEYIQSLQQTEWDVEIVTEKFFEVKGNDGIVIRAEAMEEFGERNDYKLDADGCLILKRK